MNWGKSIIAAFILFALFIGVLVTICIRQDISLVSKNYYQEELEYQQHIESQNNYNRLPVKPDMRLSARTLQINFPQEEIGNGSVTFFRPSDGKLDKKFELNGNLRVHIFNLMDLPMGRYRVKLQWTKNSIEYFNESYITL